MVDDLLYANGIDGDTGEYLLEPLTYDQFLDYIRGRPVDKPILEFLTNIWSSISKKHLGLPDGLHADDVKQAGWGVIFHAEEDEEVKNALQPLVNHRIKQVGDDRLVRVLQYSGEQDWKKWLAANGVAPGSVEPYLVPFYLLIVGSPEKIPYWFSRLLDVEYAVGRLYFERVDAYENYVKSLVEYETGDNVANSREVVFFATRHENDEATKFSADNLVIPLTDGIPEDGGVPAQTPVTENSAFRLRKLWGERATKSALTDIFTPAAGDQPPAFLFTATHGVGFKKRKDDQYSRQGALVCQDWPGEGTFRQQDYFAAENLTPESRLHGLISFNFACYSAGTPRYDQYMHIRGADPRQIADKPFFAALPKAMLSHPNGGALAVIGHVDRTWTSSFMVSRQRSLVQPFRNAILRILDGKPIGYAMKDFNERFAAYSAGLSERLEMLSWNQSVSESELVRDWLLRNDAGGYLILGDPAVSLRLDKLI